MHNIDITKPSGPNSLQEWMNREIYHPNMNSISRADLKCNSLFQKIVFWVRNDSSLIATGTKIILTVATVASCVVYVGILIIKASTKEIHRQINEESSIKKNLLCHIKKQSKLQVVFQDILKNYTNKTKIPLTTISGRIQDPLFTQGDPPIKIIELKKQNELPTYLLAIRTINKTNQKETAEYTFTPNGDNWQMTMFGCKVINEIWSTQHLENDLLPLINDTDDAILHET